MQRMVCEGIYGRRKISPLIHIYGFPKRGKTTTAFFVLQGLFLSSRQNAQKIQKVVFIDCSIDKQQVLAYFHNKIDRIKRFENTIVIIDNIEQMGACFIKVNQALFLSDKNIFILIEDDKNGKSSISNYISQKYQVFDLNDNILESDMKSQIWGFVKNFSTEDKKICFALYLMIYCRKYAKVQDICNIANVSKENIERLLLKMRDLNKQKDAYLPFAFFPFSQEIIYCPNTFVLHTFLDYFQYDKVFQDMIFQYLSYADIDNELKWMCYIQNDIDIIIKKDRNTRIALFNKALKKGHFELLYDTIKRVIEKDKKKLAVFFYEYGVLHYYMGHHKDAFDLYQCYLQQFDRQEQLRIMVRVIETSHGSIDPIVRSQLNNYLTILKQDTYYRLYADYWEVHIEIEKGVFDIEHLQEICNSFRKLNGYRNDFLYVETLKRCFSDLIRCYYLIEKELTPKLISDCVDFLSNVDINMYTYVYNLNIKAGTIQYIEIPLSYDQESTILEKVYTANSYYEKAINSEYGDRKSRLALEVKRADLNMVLVDTNVDDSISIAEAFLMHAQSNNARLHEAYADTVLAKFKMLNKDLLIDYDNASINRLKKNIKEHIDNAIQIYSQYGNIYGVIRSNFLHLLYQLLVEFNYSNVLQHMKQLTCKYPQYSREQHIYLNLQERYSKKQLNKMYIIWSIRSYMIVLQ